MSNLPALRDSNTSRGSVFGGQVIRSDPAAIAQKCILVSNQIRGDDGFTRHVESGVNVAQAVAPAPIAHDQVTIRVVNPAM